jgi:hypothetical protein
MIGKRPEDIDPDRWAAASAVSDEMIPFVKQLAEKHNPVLAIAGCMTASAVVAANHGIPAEAYHRAVTHMLAQLVKPCPANEGGVH